MTPHDLYLEPDDEPEDDPICRGCGDCHHPRHRCQVDEPDTDLELCGDYRSDEHDRRLEANYDR